MKAMIINAYGESNVFEAADIPQPEIQPGHVLVKVAATSVNTVDTMIRQMGKALPLSPDLPAVLGMDFAGTITDIGEGVEGFNVGDEVYGCAGGLADLQGTLAEYMLADADLIAKKPQTLSMKEAAGLPLVGITAYEGLQRAGISEGQKVLVHGGSGGVGHIAVQLAKYFKAEVFSTGGGKPQLDLIASLGATGINYLTEDVSDYVERYTAGKGFDVVYDSVGGENMLKSFEAAALNGHVTSTVALVSIDLSQAHFKGLSLHVVFMLIPMLYQHQRKVHGQILAKLAEIADAGHLKVVVDPKNFSLEQVGQAHDHLTSGQAMGKVVITI